MEQYNIAEVNEAVAAANPDRAAIITADRTITYAELTARTRRFANALHQRGFGAHTERAQLPGHESGQDHLGLYLHNGNEYLEGMLGAYGARVARALDATLTNLACSGASFERGIVLDERFDEARPNLVLVTAGANSVAFERAYAAGVKTPVVLRATNIAALDDIPLDALTECAADAPDDASSLTSTTTG